MGTLSLKIQVLNLSPRLTLADVTNFFSYCGTVDNIQISRNSSTTEGKLGGSQSALVTFRQPYAFQTALLLNDAIVDGKPICVLPAGVLPIPIISDEDQTEKKKEGFVGKRHIASRGAEMLSKIEIEWEEKRRVVVEQTISGIGAAEEAAKRVRARLSDVVEKACKFASHLGTTVTHKFNPNSTKQK
ncbi:uncharacterized protein LOC21388184 isoform X3 [Morus notabilis]|uniref:uncharacterized protein LOC21388184 isoform X3 n=1 Tax=Morus notabilis TaxID=981085 RepID=UPI000CED6330|nr:uncharacterized protein LOC21388184 isoform X3 [Morus notabilis]